MRPIILHRNTTLGKLDVDDKDHDDQQGADDRGELAPVAIGAVGAPADLPQLRQEAGADGHEDKDGHALAEALIGDQFGHPHDEAGAAGHDEHHDHKVPHGTVRNNLRALVVEQRAGTCGHQNGGGLQHGKADGQITGVLGQLGFAGLAFLVQCLETRDDHTQQLDDDRCGDVRHDAQCENRQLQHGAAGEEVHQTDKVLRSVVHLADALLDDGVIDARGRDE